jgi:Bacillus/Clostridium GerA spore germination protein
MIKPFFELPTINHYKAYLNSLPQRKEVKGKEVILLELTKGSAIVIVQDEIILLDINNVKIDAVLPVNLEPTIQGPELALSEDLATNINLIRHRYHKSTLTVEMLVVGEKSKAITCAYL